MKYTIIRDDISLFSADAIVLPANPMLKEGSGTSKAIFEKAGSKQLKKACSDVVKRYGKIYVGAAMPTLAFDLEANYITHAVNPKWIDGNHNEYELLSAAYLSSLEQADLLGCESLAIPLLSSGNNGFDMEVSFEIADRVISQYNPKNKLADVFLIIYGRYVTAMLREKNISFKENINDLYIFGKDEKYRTPVEKAVRFMGDTSILFLETAMNLCQEKINDPEFRKHVLKKGAEIAKQEIVPMIKTENKMTK